MLLLKEEKKGYKREKSVVNELLHESKTGPKSTFSKILDLYSTSRNCIKIHFSTLNLEENERGKICPIILIIAFRIISTFQLCCHFLPIFGV